jgi:hypothetical protein
MDEYMHRASQLNWNRGGEVDMQTTGQTDGVKELTFEEMQR